MEILTIPCVNSETGEAAKASLLPHAQYSVMYISPPIVLTRTKSVQRVTQGNLPDHGFVLQLVCCALNEPNTTDFNLDHPTHYMHLLAQRRDTFFRSKWGKKRCSVWNNLKVFGALSLSTALMHFYDKKSSNCSLQALSMMLGLSLFWYCWSSTALPKPITLLLPKSLSAFTGFTSPYSSETLITTTLFLKVFWERECTDRP